jgi:hypothetical protein
MLKRSVENSIPKSRAKGWNSFMKTLKQYQVLAVLSCLIATGFGSGSVLGQSAVTLLDGKLKLELADAFAADASHSSKQSIADYKARNSDGWGSILRGTHGLQPDGLDDYAKKKVADYTKGLSWLPRLNWLKNEIVTINGRKWADLRFIAPRKDAKDPRDGLMYTRIFATSYGGQLLEIMFTSNTDPNPALKDKIDKVIESVRLED